VVTGRGTLPADPPKTNFKPTTSFAIHDVAAPADQTTHNNAGAALNLIQPPILTESDVRSAAVVADDNGTAQLQVTLNVLGIQKMSEATATQGKQIAFVINGTVVSTPVVKFRISQRFLVSGSLSESEWVEFVQ